MVDKHQEASTGKLSFSLKAKIKLPRERVESKIPLKEMLMQGQGNWEQAEPTERAKAKPGVQKRARHLID